MGKEKMNKEKEILARAGGYTGHSLIDDEELEKYAIRGTRRIKRKFFGRFGFKPVEVSEEELKDAFDSLGTFDSLEEERDLRVFSSGRAYKFSNFSLPFQVLSIDRNEESGKYILSLSPGDDVFEPKRSSRRAF